MKPCVLLVEDVKPLARDLKAFLDKHGYSAEIATSASEALGLLREKVFDVVVTDMRLTEGTGPDEPEGLQLIGQIRSIRPGVPAILMTAFHSTGAAIDASRVGAFDYVIKGPALLQDLASTIRSAIAKRGSSAARPSLAINPEVEDLLVGRSPAMREVCRKIGQLVNKSGPVLITGEYGSGKTAVAEALHRYSQRSSRPFVTIACDTTPAAEIHSALSALDMNVTARTGQNRDLPGTLYFAEVGRLSEGMQRLLMSSLYGLLARPREASTESATAVRVIAGTIQNLAREVRTLAFDEGLYFLLAPHTIEVPPLRERSEDIPELIQQIIWKHAGVEGANIEVESSGIDYLLTLPWPGNMLQLAYVVQRALLSVRGTVIRLGDLCSAVESSLAVISRKTDNRRAVPSEAQVAPIAPAAHGAPTVADHAVLHKLGSGGYGEVWLAQTVVDSYRVVKVVRRQGLVADAFETEFAGIQRFWPVSFSHKGLVRIFQVGKNDADGYFFYVMEAADDQTSGRVINPDSYTPRTLAGDLTNRGQRLPLEECVRIGLAIAAALNHLHMHGLTHRDVKPANVIFVDGRPKLADIGLVCPIGRPTEMGTAGYAAPEGSGTPAADQYALGKLLYRIFTGNDPDREYPQMPTLPDKRSGRLNAIIMKATEESPRKRYGSIHEMEAALRWVRKSACDAASP